MQLLYKAGGGWNTSDGVAYTVRAFNGSDISNALASGWKSSIESIEAEVKTSGVDGGDYERQIRDRIKQLGGKAAQRSSIERLEEQLAELEAK